MEIVVSVCSQVSRRLNRASMDGFKAVDFHDRCDSKGECIVIIQVELLHEEFVFGGYTKRGWGEPFDALQRCILFVVRFYSIANGYKYDKEMFLFTLTNPHHVPPFLIRHREKDYAIYNDLSWGPCFYNGIYISNDCNENEESQISPNVESYIYNEVYSNTIFVNTNKKKKSNHFKVKDYEVFGII